MAKLGFGTNRIVDTNPAHIDTIITAIKNGITLFDSSIRFSDGAAHRAIAKALEIYPKRSSIEIISKFGFIQGRVLQNFAQKKELFDVVSESMVEIGKDSFYSLNPLFLQDQLTLALEELNSEYLDYFMIDSPEYYYAKLLETESKEEALELFFEALFDAFVAFEEAIKANKIKAYGIASKSFSLKENDTLYFPYEKLIELAKEAALKVQNKTHSFKAIELPINIVQKQGLFCSFWAKENDLKVMVNQPLTCEYQDKFYHLVEQEENRDYYIYLNELLDFCDNELLEGVFNLVNTLDENVHRFEDIRSYDQFIFSEVLPYIQKTLTNIDEDTKEKLVFMLDLFLNSHREMVGYECGKKTKQELSVVFKNYQGTMQQYAISYLLDQESIDFVIVGARRIKYLYEFLEIKE